MEAKRPHGPGGQMPQPPPPAPQGAGAPQDADAVAEDPAANVERIRSVSLLSHSGHFVAFFGVVMG